MHLQGKDLISLSTQKSSKALLSTAVIVILAKSFGVLPADLDLLGVRIDSSAVAGSIPIVVGLQTLNHFVNWLGDLFSSASWNAKDRVNGLARLSAGAEILTRIEKVSEDVEEFVDFWKNNVNFGSNNPERMLEAIEMISKQMASMQPSVNKFNIYSFFFVYIWHLFLPISLAACSLVLADGFDFLAWSQSN